MVVDAMSEMPVAMAVASANENEKKHSPKMFGKVLRHMKPRRPVTDRARAIQFTEPEGSRS